MSTLRNAAHPVKANSDSEDDKVTRGQGDKVKDAVTLSPGHLVTLSSFAPLTYQQIEALQVGTLIQTTSETHLGQPVIGARWSRPQAITRIYAVYLDRGRLFLCGETASAAFCLREGEGHVRLAEDDTVTRRQGDKVKRAAFLTVSPCHLVTLSSTEGVPS